MIVASKSLDGTTCLCGTGTLVRMGEDEDDEEEINQAGTISHKQAANNSKGENTCLPGGWQLVAKLTLQGTTSSSSQE